MATYAITEAYTEDDHGRHAHPGDSRAYQLYSTYHDDQGGEVHNYNTASIVSAQSPFYDADQPTYYGSRATCDVSAAETNGPLPYTPQASYGQHTAVRSLTEKKKKAKGKGKGGYQTVNDIRIEAEPPYSSKSFTVPKPYPSAGPSGGASVAAYGYHAETALTATGFAAYPQTPGYMYSSAPPGAGCIPGAHPMAGEDPYFTQDTAAEPNEPQEKRKRLEEDGSPGPEVEELGDVTQSMTAFVGELVIAAAAGLVLGAAGAAAGASANGKKAWDRPRRRRI